MARKKQKKVSGKHLKYKPIKESKSKRVDDRLKIIREPKIINMRRVHYTERRIMNFFRRYKRK